MSKNNNYTAERKTCQAYVYMCPKSQKDGEMMEEKGLQHGQTPLGGGECFLPLPLFLWGVHMISSKSK